MAGYLETARAAHAKWDIYSRRLAGARDFADLGAILSDAQVEYVAGTLTGPEVERIAVGCNETSEELPLRADPCSTCNGQDWWLSGWDGGIRCRACDPPTMDDEAWPSQEGGR